MQTHLVQPNSSGKKIKFITFTVAGHTIKKEWGLIGGKTQEKLSTYKAKNVGKRNEQSAELTAETEYEKIIKKKVTEGYVITQSLDQLPDFSDPFNFDLDNIPTSFCCSKPNKTVTDAAISKLIKTGNAAFFVKYNGGCHYIHINSDGAIRIFTRRWEDHTIKYPEIVDYVANRRHMYPPNTLIIGEFCVDPLLELPHMTAFKRFAEIAKTDTHKGACKKDQSASLELQKVSPIRVAVFGYMYFGGEQWWHLPYSEQINKLKATIKPLSDEEKLFTPQQILGNIDVTTIKHLAEVYKKSIEGFIMWDLTQSMEVTMNGKPKRKASWKIKLRGEMEVVATGGIEGKVPGEYGSIEIGRYNKDGTFQSMGSVAGLKDEEKKPEFWEFPCVIEVTYDNVFPDTGLLQFGNFSKVHEERRPDEVDLFSFG